METLASPESLRGGVLDRIAGGLLAPLDFAYLFAATGRACYGVGHILDREFDREADFRLILAIWCGSARAVAGVTTGKLAIKVVGKAALPTMAGFAARVFAKAAVKGGKTMSKLLPQVAAKLAGRFACKAGAKLVPFAGGVVSAAVSYWVAGTLPAAAEKYYRNGFVKFNDIPAAEPGLDVADGLLFDGETGAGRAPQGGVRGG